MQDVWIGPWKLDVVRRVLIEPPQQVALSENELAILQHLIAQEGRPIRRGLLQQEALGYAEGIQSRAVDAALRRLRRKLSAHASAPELLHNQRGVGVYLTGVRQVSASADDARPPPGRRDLIDRTRGQLDGPGLVSLVGPSGIGKTRLGRYLCEVEQGIWIEAEGLEDVDSLREAACRASGLSSAQLEEHPDLLVVDNVEQLAPDALRMIAEWARSGPVLVTSMRVLGLSIERQIQVPPLDDAVAREVLEAAVRRLDRTPSPRVIERVVDRVHGHPLALLLLAPYVGGLGVLSDADLLEIEAVATDRPDRHRSLGAAVERSVSMLPESTVQLLRAVSVFRSGFTLEGAVAVAEQSPRAALEQLQQLVRHSLVQQDGHCYRLLPAIRLYAAREPRREWLERKREFLLGIRAIEMRDGPRGVAPYRADLAHLVRVHDGPEWIDMLFVAEVAGTRPRELLTGFYARTSYPGSEGDLLGVRSYLARVAAVSDIAGEPVGAIRARLVEHPTALALFEAVIAGIKVEGDQFMALEPPEITPRWLCLAAGVVVLFPDPVAAMARLHAVCEERGWWFGADMTRSCGIFATLDLADPYSAYRLIRDLPFEHLFEVGRIRFQIVAWAAGQNAHAVELNERSRRLSGDRTPPNLLAIQALGAAFAWLQGHHADAVGRAETSLAIRYGGDGIGMSVVARLVLVLAGHMDRTGNAAVDAALDGAADSPVKGMVGMVVDWLLASRQPTDPRGVAPSKP